MADKCLSRVLVILCLVTLIFPATIYVNGTATTCVQGINYSTIQEGINAANAGDEIIVCQNGSGTYLESVKVNKTINLYGNESGVNVTASDSSLYVFTISSTYTNITNFTLGGASGTNAAAMYINTTSSNCKVYNVTVRDSYEGFDVQSGGLTVTHNLTNNTAVNISDTGLKVVGATDSVFYNNVIHSTAYGIYVSGSNMNFVNNTIYDNSQNGFYIVGGSANYVNNTIYNNSYGFYLSSSNNNVTYNTVCNNTIDGFYIFVGDSNNVSYNTAYGNGASGINILNSDDCTVNSNLAYDNAASNGILVTGSSDNTTVTSNIAYGNLNGFATGSSTFSNVFINNTAHDNTKGFYLSSSTGNSLINNTAFNSTQYGIYLHTSSGNSLTNNRVFNNTLQNVLLDSYSENNTIHTLVVNNSGSSIDIQLSNSQNNTFTNITFTSAIMSFNSTANITVTALDSPPSDDSGFVNASSYINITNATAAEINVSMYYASEPSGTFENILKIYKYESGPAWSEVPNSSVNINTHYVNVVINNLSLFGIFGPVIEDKSILYVNGSSNCGLYSNGSTIQDGINDAEDGAATIIVCKNGTGYYTENVIVNKTINLYGNESNILVNASNISNPVMLINSTYANITNFSITSSSQVEDGGSPPNAVFLNSSSGNCRLYNLTIHTSFVGINLSYSNNHHIFSNTIYNTSHGITLLSNYSIFEYNNISNITWNAIVINSSSYSNNFTSNNVSAGDVGFSISGDYNIFEYNNVSMDSGASTSFWLLGHYNNLSYNNGTGGGGGIYIGISGLSENNSMIGNIMHGTGYGLYAGYSNRNSFINNTFYDNLYGFLAYGQSNITVFSGNNITNSTIYAVYLGYQAVLNFSGNNGIYSTPSAGIDIYLSNSTLSTSTYNVTTYNMSFSLDNSANISLKIVDLNALSLNTVSSIDGISIFSGKVVKSLQNNYYGLNVSNVSATAFFSPKIYYNSSDLESYSTNYLGLGSSSSAGSWTYYSPDSLNTTAYSIYEAGITSFSYFAPIIYDPYVPPSHDDEPPPEPGCAGNGDCSDSEYCYGGACTSVQEGTCGYVSDHSWHSYECCSDSDCGSDETCSGNSCITKEEEEEEEDGEDGGEEGGEGGESGGTVIEPECSVNEDCSYDERCADGKCLKITGDCGYASNHEWIEYECCSNEDCGENEECKTHVCKEKGQISEDEEVGPGTEEGEKEDLFSFATKNKETIGLLILLLMALLAGYWYFRKRGSQEPAPEEFQE